MSFIKKMFQSWLPVGVAFLMGALFVGSATGHPGFPAFLHSGHSDTMNGTLTAKNFRYSTPKVVQYVVPGSAFVAGNPGNVPDHGDYSGRLTVLAGESAVAAVNLPQGAVVTKVAAWHGTSSASDWELHLESNFSAGGHDDMVILSASACASTPCSTSTTTIGFNPINNKSRAYGLWLFNGSAGDITLYRVVISYRTSSLGPVSAMPDRAPVGGAGSGTNG